MSEVLVVNGRVSIPFDEIVLVANTSSGPGGQHANRSRTRIEASFDVLSSTVLNDADRARLLDKLGPVVRAASEDERSQARNREAALSRLAAALREALHRDPPRRATRPSRGAVERRLSDKRHQAARKTSRRSSKDD